MTHAQAERQCGRKQRYPDARSAWWAAERLREKNKPKEHRVPEGPWPYWCEICDGYHVGHQRPEMKRKETTPR